MATPLTHAQVLAWIRSKEFMQLERRQVQQLFDEMNQQIKLKGALVLATFKQGDKVKWQGKYGNTETGVIVKGNRTTVQVKGDDGRDWRVSPALLQKRT